MDIGNLNTWVAGQPTPVITYGFDSQIGTFTPIFDNRTITGQVTANPAINTYTSTRFAGPGVAGVVNGTFFGPSNGTVSPPETGGNFSLQSTTNLPYSAGGVFLGHR
jgi:hypothetical protein